MIVKTFGTWPGWLILTAVMFGGVPAQASQLAATLDNGLQVLIRERPARQLVTVEVFYAAGAATEPDSLAGLAHLTEHVLVGSDLQADGSSPRRRLALLTFSSNATTSSLVMRFELECLPAFLPEVLALEADRMQGTAPDSQQFVREQAVVQEELAYRAGGAEASTYLAAYRASFPDHPYGRPVIGTPESIGRITRDDVVGFMARTIHPAAAVLIIDGPVDAQAVLAEVRTSFEGLAGGRKPTPVPALPDASAGQVIMDNREHEGYRVSAAIRILVEDLRTLALVDLAESYLLDTFGSADVTLVPTEAIISFSWFGSYYRPPAPTGYLDRFDPDQDIQRSLGWFWERIHGAVDDLAESDLRDEQAEWLAEQADLRRQDPLATWTVATALLAGIQPGSADEYADLVASIDRDDLRRFLLEHLVPRHTVIAVSHGSDSDRVSYRQMAGRVDRGHGVDAGDPLAGVTAAEIRPVLEAYAAAKLLELSTFELGNGIPVVCQHCTGTTEWELVGWRRFEPVKDARPGRRPGICTLYDWAVPYEPKLTPEGRPARDWPYDARFSVAPRGIYGYAARGAAAEAGAIATSVVERLDDDDFNLDVWAGVLRVGDQLLARAAGSAANRANAWRWARAIDAEHPAIGGQRPDPGITAGIKYKDIQKLHRRAARPTGDTTLLAIGDVAADSVRIVLESTFGRRKQFEPWTPEPPPPGPTAVEGTIVTAAREADVTLTLTFPAVVPPPDWPMPGLTLLLMEQLVDRTLDSRLRQQEGWTYSVNCSLLDINRWIVPEIRVTCQPGQAPAVLAVTREELARLAVEGWTEDRLELARLRLVSRLLRSSGDAGRMGDWMRTVTMYGPVPEDPVAAVLDLDLDAAGVELAAILPADRFVFSAVGAIFEDDLDQFDF